MKYFWLSTLLLFLFNTASSQSVTTGKEKFIFFLHNKFLELEDLNAVHPEYGRVEYFEILARFKDAGFTVISEKRKINTDVNAYALKVKHEIDSLLHTGVSANAITVIGTSKGGYITQYVSTYMNHPEIKYIIIGAYRDVDIKDYPDINLSGKILSIYEETDHLGVPMMQRIKSSNQLISLFEEIRLNTNQKHGFLYHPLDEWILPCIKFASN